MNRRAFLHRVGRPGRVAPEASPSPHPPPLSLRTGLEPYAGPLDRRRLLHLLRRTTFGALPIQFADQSKTTLADLVHDLVQQARSAPLPDPPLDINFPPPPPGSASGERVRFRVENDRRIEELRMTAFSEMLGGSLRERMTLFWHNHFATRLSVYELAAYAHRYLTLLRTHALGNTRDLVYGIGLEPAMLLFLNGAQNRSGDPNENYARELLELFTMGPTDGQGNENYTQQDVEEIARAFTGYIVDDQTLQARFRPGRHDPAMKTIFGRTGPFDYAGVIDLLFAERPDQIAAFISRKLYREFVYAVPDEAIVAELAQLLRANDFEIAPVLETLLTSAHFMDDEVIGAQIKSPVALAVGLLQNLNAAADPMVIKQLHPITKQMGQALLNPPNVAGWPGHRAWLSTDSFVARWTRMDQLLSLLYSKHAVDWVALAASLHPSSDPLAVFRLPAALAEHLLAVPVELLDVITPADGFGGDLARFPLPDEIASGPAYFRDLAQVFLAGQPWYEWNILGEAAPATLFRYVQALTDIPDFQLG